MAYLGDACEKVLAGDDQIKTENCVSLCCFARKYSCLTLKYVTSTLIAEHLADTPKDAEYLNMPYAECAKLLLSEAFVEANNDECCVAALAWLHHDSENRSAHVYDLLSFVSTLLCRSPDVRQFKLNRS